MKFQDFKDKRVVFFVAETKPSVTGFGLSAFNFASALNQFGYKTKIVCYNYNNKYKKSEKIDHVIIKRIVYFNYNLFTKIFSFPWLVVKYLIYVITSEITLVYGRYLIGYEFVLLFSILFNKYSVFRSTLLGEDDIESIFKESKILRLIRKPIFSKIDCYFAINSSFSAIWGKNFPGKENIFKSYQGVDIKKFYPQNPKKINLRNEFGISEETVIFFSCGLLIRRKGYSEIFNALQNLKYPFIYIIAGSYFETSYHKSSKKELEEMNEIFICGKNLLKDKIKFIGISTNIEDYYNASDFFIHGAYSEGTPNVLLEAMACGVPVICRKLNGIAGEILKKNINCIEYTSVNELIKILNELPNKKKALNNITEAALKSIKENCTFDVVTKRFIACLEKESL